MWQMRDILLRIRIRGDTYLWLMDRDPDPAIFVSDLHDGNKKFQFFSYYFLKVHLHHFSKQKSHKEVTKQ